MRIVKTDVKNFRLLEDVCLKLDPDTTLIVGRNNSGKTSYGEIFAKFLAGKNSDFTADDLSISAYDDLDESAKLYELYLKAIDDEEEEPEILKKENTYKAKVPRITLDVYIEYDKKKDNLSSLSKFIKDVDSSRNDALIVCECSPERIDKLFQAFKKESKAYKNDIKEFIKKNFQKFYKAKLYAVDAANPNNKTEVKKHDIENVFITQFIYAQMQLDDQSSDQTRGLSKGFEEYFKYNSDNVHVEKIQEILDKLSSELEGNYKALFDGIFTDLKTFGMDTDVNIQNLQIRSLFDPAKVLQGNTKLYYDHGGFVLPEAHNGLGYSKLIFIILSFVSFFEEFSKREPKPQFQILFIEEPEAHLHPQMQHVFIKNIQKFIKEKKGWDVQVIITTHSSHIVAESGFRCIRYFDISEKSLDIKHLSDFQDAEEEETIKFLKQYMSLNRCDMFFADKIILIEGAVERLLLPEMIQKEAEKLQVQYISTIEVGGAYAYMFEKLLDFLNVKSLIITDIDSIDIADSRKACPVQRGANYESSNTTLRECIPAKKKITELLDATDQNKLKNKICVAYQVAEEGSSKCGRSFEEAFILKNSQLLIDHKDTFKSLKGKLDVYTNSNNILDNSFDIANDISKKTDFAFDVMLLSDWATPKYIKDGLIWLQEN